MSSFAIPIESIALEPNNYHFFIAVKIGVKSARLLLDTGASRTAFDSERFLRFTKGKQSNPLEVQSVGLGSHEVFTTISSLSLIRFGTLKLTHVEVAVLNLSHVNTAYKNLSFPEIDGVLGSDLLMKFKATINLKKLELKLIG